MTFALESALTDLPRRRIAVVGDLMLDRFVLGKVDRISPEAPVPVVHVDRDDARLGGAANVAANAAGLGARVELFGVLGPGELGDELEELVRTREVGVEGLVRCDARVTTVKTRILGGGQQIVRIDRETTAPLIETTRAKLLAALDDAGDFDAIIVSDYGKGVVDESLMSSMRGRRSAGTPVVCDPKQADFNVYRGTSCITPNAREAGAAVHARVHDDASATAVAQRLLERLETDMILLTRGEQGMTLLERSGTVTHLPTEATEVYDVTGAGDTVIATFASLLGAGLPAAEAARVANIAAGIVIRELGTAIITATELRRALQDQR